MESVEKKENKELKTCGCGFRRLFGSKGFLHSLLGVGILLVITLVYFYPDVFEGNVLRQHDTLQGVANGQEAAAFAEATGETTRWTNSLFSGMPTFQISPSYGSSKLISTVERAYSLWLPNPANLVFIMMLGFYILMLAMRTRWYVALLGAIAYGFSSYFFIIIGAGHIWKFSTLAYVPPTIAGIILCYRGKYIGGGVLAAFFAMLQIAANHIQMTYYFLFVIVALVIAFFVEHKRANTLKKWAKATGVLAVAAALAVGANLPSLYNTYEYSKQTMRGGHSELAVATANSTKGGLDKNYITQWSYGISETFSLLIPNIKGGATIIPTDGQNVQTSMAEVEQVKEDYQKGKIDYQTYSNLQMFPQYFGDQPMTNGPVYVGALIFALFILGLIIVKGPVKWALFAVTVLSVALSWGHNMMWLTDWFIDHFPLYNKFRTVASILVIAEFTMPLLAALALQKIVTTPDFFKLHSKAFFGSFGISIFFCLLGMMAPSVFGSGISQMEADMFAEYAAQGYDLSPLYASLQDARMAMVSADALRSFVFLVIGAALFWLYFKNILKKEALCGALLVVVLIDMYPVDKRYLNTKSFSMKPAMAQQTIEPRPVDLQILQDTAMNYRVMDLSRFGDAMPSYFHKCIGGYHAAKLTRYQDLIDRQISKNNVEVLNMLNAKYLVVDDTTAHINPEALGNGWFVDKVTYVKGAQAEMAVLDTLHTAVGAVADESFRSVLGEAKAVMPGDTIIETVYKPNELHYKTISRNGGLAVFSEIYFPWGWTATVDGKEVPVGRVNYVLRALQLPAGEHTVVFRFDPQSVHTTETVAYASVVLIYLALIGAFLLLGKGNCCKKEE
jgi:hypothetical protein